MEKPSKGRRKRSASPGMRDAAAPLMLDFLLVLSTVAFFTLAFGYVLVCERLQ